MHRLTRWFFYFPDDIELSDFHCIFCIKFKKGIISMLQKQFPILNGKLFRWFILQINRDIQFFTLFCLFQNHREINNFKVRSLITHNTIVSNRHNMINKSFMFAIRNFHFAQKRSSSNIPQWYASLVKKKEILKTLKILKKKYMEIY